MKLLFISSLLVAATNAADVDRRRINGITFADQAVEALNLVHKGQAGSNTEQKLVVASKGGNGGNDKSSRDKSSNDKSSKSSSSKSGSSNSRDGRGVCGERDGYCKDYDSSFFSSVVASKGGDDKSSKDSKSKSSSSKSKSSSSGSRDGSRRTDRCFRACDTDRCTSADRRRLECPASTAASSDFVQKGQASPIQKLVWAGKKKGDGEDDPAEPAPAPGKKSTSTDDNKNRDNGKSSSSSKSKSSSSTGGSGDNNRSWGSGDDICKDAPDDWCGVSSADGDDACDDACDKGSDIRCDKPDRERLGCDATSNDVVATKKLRRRKA